MGMGEWVGGGILLLCGGFLYLICRKGKRPVKTLALSSSLGAAGLFLVNLLAPLTGVGFGYSLFSVGCALILGIPGVAGMLFLRLIIL